MVGSSGDVNQGTTAGGDERAGRGQSVRSSWEAGNDRGAKGRRKVVSGPSSDLSHEGSDSAARLCVRTRRKTGLRLGWEPDSGPPRWGERVGNNCAAGAILPNALSREPEPVHRETTDRKAGCGRTACPVWVGGGGVTTRLLPTSNRFMGRPTPLQATRSEPPHVGCYHFLDRPWEIRAGAQIPLGSSEPL